MPFDPVQVWGSAARTFAPNRRGIAVRGEIQGIAFGSHIVARSGKHWLLLPAAAEQAADLRVGSSAAISLAPD